MVFKKRLKRLFRKVGNKADAVLVIGDGNLLYFLTGQSEGSAIAKSSSVEYVVPRMLAEAARQTEMKVNVFTTRKEYLAMARHIVKDARTLGLRYGAVSHSMFLDLKKSFRGFKLIDITQDIADEFVQKDPEEIANLVKACKYAAQAAKAVPEMLKSGMTEVQLLREINYCMKTIGGGFVSFGENTSLPHHASGNRKLRKGDLVMVDFGCVVDGVGSDITRTFCYGKASKRQKYLYSEVYAAQTMAFNMIEDGCDLNGINKAVGKMFEADGYGPFIHSIGHSLGYFVTGFKNVEDQIVTIEPGIYIPGFGGVRIEDDILITRKGFKNLTKASPSKELIEV